jgi:hypothetical protein
VAIRTYVETSIPSFFFEVRTQPDMVARRDWTRARWATASATPAPRAHVANANKFGHIRRVNTLLGLFNPALVTPLELLGSIDDLGGQSKPASRTGLEASTAARWTVIPA